MDPQKGEERSFWFCKACGQGLLYLLLRAGGVVHSVLDYRALYALDKTPFYIMGRTLTVLFAGGTVWITWWMGRRLLGGFAAALVAFLLAVNAFHVAKSQVIEVDVPLTFFVMLTLYFALRILAAPHLRHYVLAGGCGGLATSTFWLLAGSFFVCGGTSVGLIGTHMIPHEIDHGISQVTAASLVGVMGGLNFVGTIPSGWIIDRVSPRKWLALVYALRGVALFLRPRRSGLARAPANPCTSARARPRTSPPHVNSSGMM